MVKYRYYIFALPVLFLAILFCGCGQDDTSQTNEYIVEFECPEIINMKLGTTDSSNEVALAPLFSNVDLSNCVIEYDDSIISYDASTGEIRALKSGFNRSSGNDSDARISLVFSKASSSNLRNSLSTSYFA